MGSICLVLCARANGAQAPTVTIEAASQVTGVSAIIGGTVNANGLATWAWFRWGTNTTYDHFGFPFQWPATDVTLTFSNQLTGLLKNTTYHYQLVATNSAGQTLSPDLTFITSSNIPIPVVTINPAMDVTDSTATISGTVDPDGYLVQVFVGLSTGLSSTSEFVETVPGQNGPVPVSITLSNLMSNTTYTCQLSADNVIGVASSTNITFTTLFAPTAITGPTTDITANSATISGNLNPNGFNTTYYFQWGTTTAYGNITALSSVLAQNTAINGIATGLSGLSVGTTYHYQFVATNTSGIYFGGDMSFTTASTITIQGQTFSYSTNDGAVTITAYAGPGGVVTIPSSIGGLPVTAIAESVFASRGNLSTVTLPDTLRTLGFGCFAGCGGLARAALPTGLTGLPDSVFSGCTGLTSITIPNSVTNIGAGAFANCTSLTNVIIGNSVLSIGSSAFWSCTNLTVVTIPASTVSIDLSIFQNGAFGGCTGLKEINVDSQNSVYSSTDGVLFSKDQSELFLYPPANSRTYYAMPNAVIFLADSAFLNCSNLTGVRLGNHVANIANWAFLGCSGLSRLVLPDSVTNIDNAYVGGMGNGVAGGVFYGCTSLTNVVVGKGLSYLGLGAFFGCTNLLSVYFKGDAPTPGRGMPGPVFVFGYDDPTTVYYLPGTTGWDGTYAGQPAVLWNPQIQTGDGGFGVRLNGFGFNVTGTADIPVIIEACTNPNAGLWVLLQSCTLTNGSVYFRDAQWMSSPSRLYRIRSP